MSGTMLTGLATVPYLFFAHSLNLDSVAPMISSSESFSYDYFSPSDANFLIIELWEHFDLNQMLSLDCERISIQVASCQSLIIQTASMDRTFGKQITNFPTQADSYKPNMFVRIHCLTDRAGSTVPKTRCKYQGSKLEVVSFKPQDRKINSVDRIQSINSETREQGRKTNEIEGIQGYFEECFKHMLSRQSNNYDLRNYIPQQTQITAKMRGILLDWIVELHHKFKMCAQTLFMTVLIIDKYACRQGARKDNLQLIGSAAFYLAAKFEEVSQVPRIDELVYYSDRAFKKEQLIQMEAEILELLDYNLVMSTAHTFFSPLAKLCKLDQRYTHLGQYIIELSLLESHFLQYKPSQIAASSIYLISKISQAPQSWPKQLKRAIGYSESELRQCAKDLCHLFEQAGAHPNNRALRNKFSLREYGEVTRIKLQRKKA